MSRKSATKSAPPRIALPSSQAAEPTPGLVFRDFVRLLEELAGTRESKTRTQRAAPRRRR